MKEKLSKNDITGLVSAVVFHALLLLCLFLFGFKTPLPLPEEQGIEIDMGGGGGGSSAPQPVVAKPQTSTNTNYLTQNTEDAGEIYSNKVDKKTDDEVEKKPEQVVDNRLIYRPGANKTLGKGDGTGDGSGQGSGKGDGSGSGSGGGIGSGTGGGNGPSFSLSGRKSRLLPAPDIANAQGSVVVRIKVDRDGNVIDAEAISRGSTIANTQVWRKCEEFARKSKFDAKPDAPEIQMGTITYVIL